MNGQQYEHIVNQQFPMNSVFRYNRSTALSWRSLEKWLFRQVFWVYALINILECMNYIWNSLHWWNISDIFEYKWHTTCLFLKVEDKMIIEYFYIITNCGSIFLDCVVVLRVKKQFCVGFGSTYVLTLNRICVFRLDIIRPVQDSSFNRFYQT